MKSVFSEIGVTKIKNVLLDKLHLPILEYRRSGGASRRRDGGSESTAHRDGENEGRSLSLLYVYIISVSLLCSRFLSFPLLPVFI